MGEVREAEPLVREALRIYRLTLSEGSWKIVAAKTGLAEILQSLGRPFEVAPPLASPHRVGAAPGPD